MDKVLERPVRGVRETGSKAGARAPSWGVSQARFHDAARNGKYSPCDCAAVKDPRAVFLEAATPVARRAAGGTVWSSTGDRQSQLPMLLGPIGGQIGEAGDAEASGQGSVRRGFDNVWREESERENHAR